MTSRADFGRNTIGRLFKIGISLCIFRIYTFVYVANTLLANLLLIIVDYKKTVSYLLPENLPHVRSLMSVVNINGRSGYKHARRH